MKLKKLIFKFSNIIVLTVVALLNQSCFFQMNLSLHFSRPDENTHRIRSLVKIWTILEKKEQPESGLQPQKSPPGSSLPKSVKILASGTKETEFRNMKTVSSSLTAEIPGGTGINIFDFISSSEKENTENPFRIMLYTQPYGIEMHFVPAEISQGNRRSEDIMGNAMAKMFIAGAVRSDFTFDSSFNAAKPVVFYLDETRKLNSKELDFDSEDAAENGNRSFSFPPVLLSLGLEQGGILLFAQKGRRVPVKEYTEILNSYKKMTEPPPQPETPAEIMPQGSSDL